MCRVIGCLTHLDNQLPYFKLGDSLYDAYQSKEHQKPIFTTSAAQRYALWTLDEKSRLRFQTNLGNFSKLVMVWILFNSTGNSLEFPSWRPGSY